MRDERNINSEEQESFYSFITTFSFHWFRLHYAQPLSPSLHMFVIVQMYSSMLHHCYSQLLRIYVALNVGVMSLQYGMRNIS